MAVDARERCRNTSPISSSEAPLRSMSVARLWRSRCEPMYFCGGRRGLLECRAQHRIQDLRIGERPIRHPMRDEQGARRSTTTILDVIDDGLAGLFGQRHAVVPLALAP